MAKSDPRADDIEWSRPILLLAGPTASGKSRLALDLARRRNAVILNADSQQLYADLRILTARPSEADERLAEHRLYGLADAADAWSAGRWLRAIEHQLATLATERRPAIVVGGTGLYFRALTGGLADIPAIPGTLRDQAEDLYHEEGENAFRARLAARDPASAGRIAPGDRQRLVRAFSVVTTTGRPLGEWQALARPALSPHDYDTALLTPDRATLYTNCDRRVEAMLAHGAITEVRDLLARGLCASLPAMKAVGVREIAAHLSGELNLAAAAGALALATRHYAKRQMTWFRNQCPEWARVGWGE